VPGRREEGPQRGGGFWMVTKQIYIELKGTRTKVYARANEGKSWGRSRQKRGFAKRKQREGCGVRRQGTERLGCVRAGKKG